MIGSSRLCRTEHIVAWVLRGQAPEGPLELERHRMGERQTYEFDSAEELRAWASAGGAFASG